MYICFLGKFHLDSEFYVSEFYFFFFFLQMPNTINLCTVNASEFQMKQLILAGIKN